MLAYAVHGMLRAQRLAARRRCHRGACPLEAFGGCTEPFDARLHQHPAPRRAGAGGRAACASFLAGSELQEQPKAAVQDPYSFRCQPQVHGATRDALAYVAQVVETECNSVTDNPNIFPEDDAILSAAAISMASRWPWRSISWP